MWNKKIIGIDIDNLALGKYTLNVFRVLGINGVWRLSSSKRGYHFRLKLKKPCSKKINLAIRYMFNDDFKRCTLDIRKLKHGIKHVDVLFDYKKGKKSGKWRKI